LTGLVVATIPVMALFVLGIVGIPLWITFKHPAAPPDYSEADAHLRAKARARDGGAVPGRRGPAVHPRTAARRHLGPWRPGTGHRRPSHLTKRQLREMQILCEIERQEDLR
jgi:hypothetical protein